MISLLPYTCSLIYWVLFFLAVNNPQFTLAIAGILAIWYGIIVIIIGRRHLVSERLLWLSGLLFLASSYGMMMIINSVILRNLFVVISGFLVGIWFQVVLRYIRDTRAFLAKFYLQFLSFIYLITFWQFFVVTYALLILYDYSISASLVVVLLIVYLLSRGMIHIQPLRKSSETLVITVLTITTLEFYIALHLLPFHYVTLATMLTVWFFYFIEMVFAGQEVSSRKVIFRRYTVITLAALLLIFLTARWI